MSRSSRPRVGRARLVPLAVLSLLTTACGGDGGIDRAAASPTPTLGATALSGQEAAVLSAREGDDGSLAAPETTTPSRPVDSAAKAELEQEWATTRATVAWNLSAAVYGVTEDRVLVGPGGLRIDLTDCPIAWNDTAGLDDDSITIAMVVARSGTHAEIGGLADGFEAYLDQVNEEGGIGGRTIELKVVDDGYSAEKAVEATNGLLAEGEPFYVTTVGTPGSLAVRRMLGGACIPQPLVASPHPAWGDPEAYPFASGFPRAQTTEALQWGAWLEDNLSAPEPVTVGVVAIDNDFGWVYVEAVRRWAATVPELVANVVVAGHDPTSERAAVADGLDSLVAAEPEVVMVASSGLSCGDALLALHSAGISPGAQARFLVSDCIGATTSTSLATSEGSAGVTVGEAVEGFRAVGAGMGSINDPALADEPFVELVRSSLTSAGLDPTDEMVAVGYAQYGWAHVELLRLAAELPGGLSRTNLALALRSLRLDHPMLLDGVPLEADGIEDPYLVEGGELLAFRGDRGGWVAEGPVVDVNASTPPCDWRGGSCQE